MKLRIKEIRKKRGITQKHVADSLGVTQQTLSKWERGAGYPNAKQLYELAAVLFVELSDLYEGDEQ